MRLWRIVNAENLDITAFNFEMIEDIAFNIEKTSIMNTYNDYLNEIEKRKGQGLHPKPIDGAELLSEIIAQIKDLNNVNRKDSLNFFIYNVVPGTTSAADVKAKFLKEKNPNIRVLGVDAFGSVLKKYHETKEFDAAEIYPYRIEGLGKNLIPTATDFDLIDHFMKVTDEESAHTTRDIVKREGLFVGYTSGAVLQATSPVL